MSGRPVPPARSQRRSVRDREIVLRLPRFDGAEAASGASCALQGSTALRDPTCEEFSDPGVQSRYELSRPLTLSPRGRTGFLLRGATMQSRDLEGLSRIVFEESLD